MAEEGPALRVIVIGGSSFIGRNLLGALNGSGISVSATYTHSATFPELAANRFPNVVPVLCDLVSDDLDFSGYDTAVYMAGNSNHTWAQHHPTGDLDLNAKSMTRFLNTFRGRLILLSTGAVYFGQKGLVSPSSITQPAFPYAISKLAGELYVRWAYETGRLHAYTILRLYYAYGPGEQDRRLIRRLLTRFGIEGERTFTINGDGQSYMAPLHVSDVARAIGLLLSGSTRSSGTYDLTAPKPSRVVEIVRLAAQVCDIEPAISFAPTDEAPLHFHSDGESLALDYGFRPQLSLEAGMSLYLSELRSGAAG